MSTLITRVYPDADETTSPTLVLAYEAARESSNTVINILGGGIAIAYGAARPRTGTLDLFYPNEFDANDSAVMHALIGSFTLVSTERSTVDMDYVVDGDITVELDDETRDAWVVHVDFQEI